jgi:hypothetical protein
MDAAVDTGAGGGKSSFVRLTFMIIALTVGLSIAMTFADRESVMNDWANQRCKTAVMATAFLYKPADYNGSASDFAAENYNFCLKHLAGKTLQAGVTPVTGVLQQQVGSSGVIGEMQNSIRNMLGTMGRELGSGLDIFYQRYQAIQGQVTRIMQYLKSAMGRISGVIGATVYLTVSMIVSMINTIEFIVWICIIIVIILVVIFIILFFILAPFSPLLLAVVTVIAAAGFGAMIGGAASVFCFAEDTTVLAADNKTIKVQDLVVGDKLSDGSTVEGMFVFDGTRTPLYDLYGCLVSGTHIVYDAKSRRYCEVADHPDARLTIKRSTHVYCPITSSRKVSVITAQGRQILFCDWEEVVNDEGEEVWMKAVYEQLGINVDILQYTSNNYNNTNNDIAGLRPHVKVAMATGQWCPIELVSIGDTILYGRGQETKVLGKVLRHYEDHCNSVAPGTWMKNATSKSWQRGCSGLGINKKDDRDYGKLYHLITDSGTFVINSDGLMYEVRDATEVGAENLRSCTPAVLSALNSSSQ